MDGFWIALVGLGGAVLGALISRGVVGRAWAADPVHDQRLQAYPSVWEQTAVVSRWPRTDAGWAHLHQLHVTLRSWYYEVGGLYLSENARGRYGSLQELLASMLDPHRADASRTSADGEVPGPDYTAVMEEASAFRSALTEDLQSREQRSLIATIDRALTHRRQRSAAKTRLLASRPPAEQPAAPVPSDRPEGPAGATSPTPATSSTRAISGNGATAAPPATSRQPT